MSSPSTSAYNVRLALYEGPLDLLLYLVRRNEIDVLDISLSTVVQQFLLFVETIEQIDIDAAGDFLVTAAALAEMKSRNALPHEQSAEEGTEDPIVEEKPNDLVLRLLEYKKYKDASLLLEKQGEEWHERYVRRTSERPSEGKDPAVDHIREVELWDLVSALGRIMRRKILEKETRIKYQETPISVFIEQIGERVRRDGRVPFSVFFEGTNRRSRIVSIFLAILELIRHHQFRVEQPADFGDIWVLPPIPRG